MKRILVIAVSILLLGFINYALIIEPWSSASTAMPLQGTPFFSINSIEVTEGTNPQAVFSVSLTYQGGSREFSASVSYSTANGTAIAAGGGGDYEPRSGTVTFPPGPTPGGTVSMTISVPIVDDNVVEGDETFTVALSNPSPAFVIQGPGTCIIHDNDGPPSPVRRLPGLESLTFYEQSTGLGIRPFNFTVSGPELTERRADPLGATNNDFIGSAATIGTAAEFYDAYYSDADSAFNLDGRYITIECVHDCPVCTSLNIAQVNLNFTGGRVGYFNQVASFVALGSRAQPGTAVNAVDGNLETITVLGNTVGQTQRLRLTLGFLSGPTECSYSLQPMSASFPGEGGTETFIISAPGGCEWSVRSNNPFINLSSPSFGSGSSPVSYGVIPNPNSSPRSGVLVLDPGVVGGGDEQSLTVTQEGSSCPYSGYSISGGGVHTFDEGSNLGSFQVTAPPGCGWHGVTNVDWITLNRCYSEGIFSQCSYTVHPNRRNIFRIGVITVVGHQVTVIQHPEVNCSIEVVCFLLPRACDSSSSAGEITRTSTLELSRNFRDMKLARTPRGQRYTRLYYQFSSEAVQTLMFNPMLVLRSREILERYRPVLQAMVEGQQVTLTRADLDEIDGFLSSFAAKGSPDLQEAIKEVCQDLRDPEVHAEFAITVTEGPMRQLPAQGQLQRVVRMGGFTTLFGFFLICVYRISRSRRKNLKRGLVVGLAMLLVSGQWPGVSQESDFIASFEPAPGRPPHEQTAERHEKLPITFEGNQGQTDPRVKFISRTSGYNLFLTPTETVMSFRRGQESKGVRSQDQWQLQQNTDHRPLATELRMKFIGANSDAQLAGVDLLPGRANYFIGNDPARWRANIPTYARVKSKDVYPGVDMVYYGNPGELEYDFIVAPGADHRAIRLGFDGADRIEIDEQGDLVLHTPSGELRHRKPFVYQEVNGIRQAIPGRYTIIRNPPSAIRNPEVGIEVGSYDAAWPLIIDPVLAYSTYLGGSGADEGNAIAVDEAGNVYVAGFTNSLNFPTASASQPAFGGGQQDAFVVKLDPAGRMIYSTYLGGDGQDNATSIAVDGTGNAWFTGFTDSTSFPVRNAFQPNRAGPFNAIIARLDASGSLAYSTHLGGSAGDHGSSIAVDASGNVYVAGIATSSNFPLMGALQSSFGGATDLYVAKFNPTGRQLIYSTYLGGAGIDGASSIAVDATGNVYLTGLTSSPNFRTANALQGTHRGGLFDAFVAKLNPSGSDLVYSTYLGGSGEDRGLRIAVDAAGNAYVTGDTDSSNFPTIGSLQANNGGSVDAFVAKLSPTGNQLVYSSYLGGSGIEGGAAVAIDGTGSAVVAGFTGSTNFPTVNGFQQTFGGGSFDGFVAKISPTGAALDYATYLGGSGIDGGFGVAVDAAGIAYVMGLTDSSNFPTANPLQPANSGGASDVFVSRIKPGPVISNVGIQGKNVIVTGSGFERGAVILLNGEDQKTQYKSATSLKGKKVGRRIAPGQTVRIQVRIPDSLTSNEFSFTRP